MEIDALSKKILSTVIFEETFENIWEDSGEKNANIVRDILRTLIVRDLVRVYEWDQEAYKAVSYQNPEFFKGQFIRITAKGIGLL